MGNDRIRFPVKFHTLAFVAGLTAGFTAALLPETLWNRLVESVIGWRCGTVATVLLMVLLVKLGRQFCYLFCQRGNLRILCCKEFILDSKLLSQSGYCCS